MRQINHLIQTSSKEIVSGHRCSLQIPQFLNILQWFFAGFSQLGNSAKPMLVRFFEFCRADLVASELDVSEAFNASIDGLLTTCVAGCGAMGQSLFDELNQRLCGIAQRRVAPRHHTQRSLNARGLQGQVMDGFRFEQ